MKKIMMLVIMLLILCSCSRFDQATWINEPENRDKMVSSLTSKYVLVGMTDNEIINILGQPDQEITIPSREFLYFIGYAGLGVKVSLLQLKFDKNGIVESHRIIYK